MKYVIKGEPLASIPPREQTIWSEGRATRLNYIIQLENQHANGPLLKGPIGLEVNFYHMVPFGSRKKYPGCYHVDRPNIANLLKVIEDMGRGSIFADNCKIAHINATKQYDIDPRTEITISILQESV